MGRRSTKGSQNLWAFCRIKHFSSRVNTERYKDFQELILHDQERLIFGHYQMWRLPEIPFRLNNVWLSF